MREIKFRAWDELNQEMVYERHGLFDSGAKSSWEILKLFENVMQFTGLHDKNGVEIYEGDIVSVRNGYINGNEWMEKNYVVKFKAGRFVLHLFLWDNEGNSMMDSTHWLEVIGNVHENPELLK